MNRTPPPSCAARARHGGRAGARLWLAALLVLGAASAHAQAPHGAATAPEPIDTAFERCEQRWDGHRLQDWRACIRDARQRWQADMHSTLERLARRLPADDARRLRTAQRDWARALRSDERFVHGLGDARARLGAEGLVEREKTLMLATRQRALDLRAWERTLAPAPAPATSSP